MMPTDVVLGRRHHKKREKLKICAADKGPDGFQKNQKFTISAAAAAERVFI